MPNNESRRYWAHSNAKHWTCNVWSGLTRGWVFLWAHRTLDYRCLSTFLEIQQGRMINGINYINNLKCIKMSSVAFYWISSFIVLVSWKKNTKPFYMFFSLLWHSNSVFCSYEISNAFMSVLLCWQFFKFLTPMFVKVVYWFGKCL